MDTDFATSLLSLPSPVFILGPAYSGKSALASQCMDDTKPGIVIGTAVPHDEILIKRIDELKKSRPFTWKTVDHPENLPTLLSEIAGKSQQIMIDSLNLWIAAKLVDDSGKYSLDQISSMIQQDGREICSVIKNNPSTRFVIVSSEVGAAPASARPAERLLRSTVGLLNQQFATEASSVMTVTAGIPQLIK